MALSSFSSPTDGGAPLTAIDRALAANARYPGPGQQLVAPPAARLLVLTCMDARVEPLQMLGLELGDAHVLRNAGGRVTEDVLRSLTLSQHLLGTREVMVIHHTDCGMYAPDPARLRGALEDAVGADTSDLELLSFDDEEGGVREDLETLRAWRLLHPDTLVRGFLYDVHTGRLREVATAAG